VAVQAQRDWTFNADAALTIGEEEATHVTASLKPQLWRAFRRKRGQL